VPRGEGYYARILLVFCLAYWISLGDESLKIFVPDRMAEFPNILNNLKAVTLAMFLFAPEEKKIPQTRFIGAAGLVFFAISVLATGLFLQNVQGFGYRIRLNGGWSFYSAFSAPELAGKNQAFARGEPDAKYGDEAKRHLFQREFYHHRDFPYWNPDGTPGGTFRYWDKTRGENLILETYYSNWLEREGKRWPADTAAEISRRCPALPAGESRVKATIVVRFSARQMWLAAVLLLGLGLTGYWKAGILTKRDKL
jgi:hypothetical protein